MELKNDFHVSVPIMSHGRCLPTLSGSRRACPALNCKRSRAMSIEGS